MNPVVIFSIFRGHFDPIDKIFGKPYLKNG
jgi:hypothetical protein